MLSCVDLGRRITLHFFFIFLMFVLHFFPHGIETENSSIWLLFVNTRKKNYDSSDANDAHDEAVR